MSSTQDLEQRIREKLQAAEQTRSVHADHVRRRMEELDRRTARFNAIAGPLVESIIRPRVEALARHFANSDLSGAERRHCPCTFKHTDQFPASTRFDVFVTADSRRIRSAMLARFGPHSSCRGIRRDKPRDGKAPCQSSAISQRPRSHSAAVRRRSLSVLREGRVPCVCRITWSKLRLCW